MKHHRDGVRQEGPQSLPSCCRSTHGLGLTVENESKDLVRDGSHGAGSSNVVCRSGSTVPPASVINVIAMYTLSTIFAIIITTSVN